MAKLWRYLACFSCLFFGPILPSLRGEAGGLQAEGIAFFESRIRPIFAEHCESCHSTRAKKIRGGLLLDSKEAWTRGGDSGQTILPGRPEGSLLIRAIRYDDASLKMPPDKKLPAKAITDVIEWVKMGAPDPRSEHPGVRLSRTGGPIRDLRAARQHWAFQGLKRVDTPEVRDRSWCRNPIDSFILMALEHRGLTPNSEASAMTLVRRLSLDLTGLPPTPREVQVCLNDRSQVRHERLITRLLASPRYGERWARHWLDLARFAESHGFEHDTDRPTAYPYRDLVIEAFNRDLRFDTFVAWQLAGDEIAPNNPLALQATGFLAGGVHNTQITANQVEKERYDELDDFVATIGTAMLGLTIGCGRCHDHKYDPITQEEYYRLASIFTTTVRTEIDLPPALPGQNAGPPGRKALICSEGLKPLRLSSQGADFFEKTYVLHRGDPKHKLGEAVPGYLGVLMSAPDGVSRWQIAPPTGARTSHRRRGLANWMTDVERGAGALLARVIVNRLWQHHFGRGLVATPSDFGTQGDPPSHPNLLEWLANELVRGGWRLKPIHELIVSSATYRQSSVIDAGRASADPDNILLSRYSRRRLEAEAIRDSMLAVSGRLDQRMFGVGTLDEGQDRRSIYLTIKRSRLIPMLQLFDAPDTLQGIALRSSTIVSPQSLLLLNGPNVRRWAASLAHESLGTVGMGRREGRAMLASLVEQSYRSALARMPRPAEQSDALAFLEAQIALYGERCQTGPVLELALTDLCQVLLALNEFAFVE